MQAQSIWRRWFVPANPHNFSQLHGPSFLENLQAVIGEDHAEGKSVEGLPWSFSPFSHVRIDSGENCEWRRKWFVKLRSYAWASAWYEAVSTRRLWGENGSEGWESFWDVCRCIHPVWPQSHFLSRQSTFLEISQLSLFFSHHPGLEMLDFHKEALPANAKEYVLPSAFNLWW